MNFVMQRVEYDHQKERAYIEFRHQFLARSKNLVHSSRPGWKRALRHPAQNKIWQPAALVGYLHHFCGKNHT
jgi:hypothetical protein